MSVLKFCFKNIQTLNLTFSYGLTGDLTTFPISAERMVSLHQILYFRARWKCDLSSPRHCFHEVLSKAILGFSVTPPEAG